MDGKYRTFGSFSSRRADSQQPTNQPYILYLLLLLLCSFLFAGSFLSFLHLLLFLSRPFWSEKKEQRGYGHSGISRYYRDFFFYFDMMISRHGSVSRRFISIAHTGHIDHGHAALVVLIWNNNNKKKIPQTNTRKLIINNHKIVVMLCWTHFNCHPFQTMRPQSNNNKKKKKYYIFQIKP